MSNVIIQSSDPSDVDDIALSITYGPAPVRIPIHSIPADLSVEGTDSHFKDVSADADSLNSECSSTPSSGTKDTEQNNISLNVPSDMACNDTPPTANVECDIPTDSARTDAVSTSCENLNANSISSTEILGRTNASHLGNSASNDTRTADWRTVLDEIPFEATSSSEQHNSGHITLAKLFKTVLCDKRSCIRWLMSQGLLSTGFSCPECGGPMKLTKGETADGITWICLKRKSYRVHRKKVSIRTGSWFYGSNMTFEKILLLTYLWSNAYSSSQIKYELGLSSQTLTDWLYQCREVCMVYLLDNCQQLGGSGKIVEVYESDFTSSKCSRVEHIKHNWVIGAIERYTSNVFLVPVSDTTEKTLCSFVSKWIRKGSIIYSECWGSFKKLCKMGYQHKTIDPNKHSDDFSAKKTDVEKQWTKAKNRLPAYGSHNKFPSGYLAEALWRMKVRDREDTFLAFLEIIKYVYNPVKACSLLHETGNKEDAIETQ